MEFDCKIGGVKYAGLELLGCADRPADCENEAGKCSGR